MFCVYAHVCVCVCGGAEIAPFTQLQTSKYTHIHTHTHRPTHPPTQRPTHPYPNICIKIRMYIYIYMYACIHVYVCTVTICACIFGFCVDVFVKKWWGGRGPISGVSRAACKLMETSNGTDTASSSSTILDTAAACRKIQKQKYRSKQFPPVPQSHYLSFPPRIRQPNPLKFSDLRHNLLENVQSLASILSPPSCRDFKTKH